MIPVSGFTIVKNAVTLDFPVVPAIRSILPLCEEVVVNVGRSDDGTLDLIHGIGDPRVRVIESDWAPSRGGTVLAEETQRAMAACRHRWGMYIQADEVLHEDGVPRLRDAIAAVDDDRTVEAVLVDYLHFYGAFDRIAVNRHWYRREVRALRLDADLRSFRDAQGFRAGDAARRPRARRSGALMFHYGWARPPAAIARRRVADRAIFGEGRGPGGDEPVLPWTWGLRRFTGAHPAAAADWIAGRLHERTPLGPRSMRGQWRFALSDVVERLTGWQPFPYRNYVEA